MFYRSQVLSPFRRGIALMSLSLLLIACRPAPSSPSPTLYIIPASSSTLPPYPTSTPCDVLLLPLRDAASWQYRLTAPDGSQQDFAMQSHIASGTLSVTFGSDTASLICTDGSLISLPAGMIGSGHPSLGGALLANNPEGAFLPSPDVLSMASPWDLQADAAGSITLPLPDPTTVPILSGKIVISSFASDPIQIDTPAGSFSAIPIQQTIFYQITIQHPDGSQPQILINASMTQYYAENVGLVRAEFSGGTITSADASITANLAPGYTLDLLNYSIP